MLTLEEITRWDLVISKSNDTSIIRQFYSKIGRHERIKQIFKDSAKHFAESGLLEPKIEKKSYAPELSDDELQEIAHIAIKQDIANKYYREALSKLDDEIYRAKISDSELSLVVNACVSEDKHGNEIASNPDDFAQRLVEFRTEEGVNLYEDVYCAYYLFDNKRYKNFIKDEFKKNIVTLQIFSSIVGGNFEEASKIKSKHAKLYDDNKLNEWLELLVPTLNLNKNDDASDYKYACLATHSEFLELFVNAGFDNIEFEKPKKAPKKSYVQQLNESFDNVEDDFESFLGCKHLKFLLKQNRKIQKTGKSVVKQTLQERINKAAQINPFSVYELLYGFSLFNCDEYPPIGGIKKELEKYVSIDLNNLFNSMMQKIEYNESYLLSDDYSFHSDNLTFWKSPSEICDAYELHLKLANEGKESAKKEELDRIVFLKIALSAKESYEGKGMREIVKVVNEPHNQPHINLPKLKLLFDKVFKEGFEEGYFQFEYVSENHVSYFYQLVNSPVGKLFKDDARFEQYFKLHEFLSAPK